MSYAEFDAIRIGIASPEQIREWSYGEVKKPETINYHTLTETGTACSVNASLAPPRTGSATAVKYKKIRYKADLRPLRRGGHPGQRHRGADGASIELAAPVSHIWYLRGSPPGWVCCWTCPRILEKVLSFAAYIVTDPGYAPW